MSTTFVSSVTCYASSTEKERSRLNDILLPEIWFYDETSFREEKIKMRERISLYMKITLATTIYQKKF